jgi:hypothetical protein
MCEIGSARESASSRNHPRNELHPEILRTLATYSRSAAAWLRQVANSSASTAMDGGLNPPSLNTYLLPSDAGRSRGSIPTLAHSHLPLQEINLRKEGMVGMGCAMVFICSRGSGRDT